MSRKRQKKTLFLIGKNKSPGENSKRNLLTSKLNSLNLLHSDKSTYFYESKLRFFMLIPACALLGLVGLLIFPSHINATYATDDANSNTPVALSGTNLSLRFGESRLSRQIEAGTPGFQATDMYVTATNIDPATGYSLSIQTTSASSSLISAADSTKTVDSINPNIATVGSELTSNTWGYSLSEGLLLNNITDESEAQATLAALSYKAVGNNSDPRVDSNYATEANNKPFTLAFGANIGTDMPTGSYTTDVLVSLVAGAGEVANISGFAGKIYMQDIDKTFCDSDSIAKGTQGQVIDQRDGNIYWIAKLDDGLCWMTQNLDYGVGTYDPGLRLYNGSTTIEDFINVNDNGNYTLSTNEDMASAIQASSTEPGHFLYNGHYLIGNYYTYYQATDGTAGTSGNAADSICPENWNLPIGDQTITNNATIGSFGKLFESAGAANNASGANKIETSPMFFLKGGSILNGTRESVGTLGWYWSSTAYNSINAYSISFTSSQIYPGSNSHITSQSRAMFVRCVAR